MTLNVGRAKLQFHPLALMFPLASAMLGAGEDAAALIAGLAVHEGAHLLAARLLGVGIDRVRMMPFGGAIELENPYALPPARLAAVAGAGPLGSCMMLVLAAALAHWRMLSPALALALVRVNMTLMLFNLLPALPLDGGRLLYAALCPRLGPARAAEAGIWAGRVAAAGLLGAAIAGAMRWGRFNLSFLFAAVFILASAADERRALAGTRVRAMLSALKPLRRPVPVRLWAVDEACDARSALQSARADGLNLYAVYKDNRLASLTDDRRLLEAALARGMDISLGEAAGLRPTIAR